MPGSTRDARPVRSSRPTGPRRARRSTGRMEAMALNRVDRLRAAVERDGATCIWCGRGFAGLVAPTAEHVVPRLKGGPAWLENEVAAGRRCKSERGHRGAVEWLEECLARGW